MLNPKNSLFSPTAASSLFKSSYEGNTIHKSFSDRSSIFVTDSLSSPIKSAASLLEHIEQDLKLIDRSFGFEWDDEISLIYAAKCIKQSVQFLIQEREKLKTKEKELDLDDRFFHLKKFETSLKQKERLLGNSENSLKAEKLKAEQLIKKVQEDQRKIKEQKQGIEQEYFNINEENQKIDLKIKKLDEKYGMILDSFHHRTAISSINSKSFSPLISHENFVNIVECEKDKKDYDLLKDRFEEAKGEIAKLKESLENALEENYGLKEKIGKYERHEVEKKTSDKEIEEIEYLKKEVLKYHELIIQEQIGFKAQFGIQLENLINIHKNIEEKLLNATIHEENTKTISENLKKQLIDLENEREVLKNIEDIKEKYETFQSRWEDMQSDLIERIRSIEIKEIELTIQKSAIDAIRSRDTQKLFDILHEIECKLEQLHKEEEEMKKIQQYAAKTKQENEITSEILTNIHEELVRQQDEVYKEYENVQREKKKLEQLYEKLEAQTRSIDQKETEILEKMQRMIEKEESKKNKEGII